MPYSKRQNFENCNKKASGDSVKITIIVVIAVVVLAILAMFLFAKPSAGTTINTNGVAQIKAEPDLVSVYVNVETNGTTTKDANDKNSEIVDNLLTGLIKKGFERKDITTENFNVYPDYTWENGTQELKDYKATHSLKIQMSATKLEKIGQVIDVASDAGAFVSSINFELSVEKQNQYKAEALKQATLDAKTKAESIAIGLGKRLGKLVSVSDSSFDYYPWPIYARAGDVSFAESNSQAKVAATNIQPGQQNVDARVSVVFKIV